MSRFVIIRGAAGENAPSSVAQVSAVTAASEAAYPNQGQCDPGACCMQQRPRRPRSPHCPRPGLHHDETFCIPILGSAASALALTD